MPINAILRLASPADIVRSGFADKWEPVRLTSRREPASPTTPTRRLMNQPTAQPVGTHTERQHRKRDNQSDWCLLL